MTGTNNPGHVEREEELAFLLGEITPEGFVYSAHRIVCTDGFGARWCVRVTGENVTACGRHAPSEVANQAADVFTTCASCGSSMALSGLAMGVPSNVAADAATAYWRRVHQINEEIEL